METWIEFEPKRLPARAEVLRAEVRAFLDDEIAAGTFTPYAARQTGSVNRAFSQKCGERGWIGMTWPKRFGGGERSHLDRYVVTEEFRAVGAPTRYHFVADRQSGPVIMKYGSPELQEDVLPRITRGEVCFCIGMSEPNSGSDLFAAAAKAERVDGGWQLSGTKLWTSYAHVADYMIGLFRTSAPTKENRRHGLTQFVIDMTSPGMTVNPIRQMTGYHEFNEVVFDGVFVPDSHVLGEIDSAWKQATAELAYERSGPERFLETFYTLVAAIDALGEAPGPRDAEEIGRITAELHTLRRMSVSVAGMLADGREPVLEASIVKDLGTVWEQELPARARALATYAALSGGNAEALDDVMDYAALQAPKFTIQGGTTEILRGIIARGLDLR